MSELNLIKKLERLSEEKPQREWAQFTKESILASNPKIQKQGIGLFFESFNLASYAPMMVCVFVALIFGGFINLFENSEGGETMAVNDTSVAADLTGSVSDIASMSSINEPVESNPLIATIENEQITTEEEPITNGDSLAVVLDDVDAMAVSEEIANRVQRIKNEVKECKKLDAQGLLESGSEEKQKCDNLEDQLNYFEQILGEQKSE